MATGQPSPHGLGRIRLLGLLLGSVFLLALLPTPGQADPPTSLPLRCDGAAPNLKMMEWSYVALGCWAHIGIHHYFPGNNTTYALHGGSGSLFSVEQHRSLPNEFGNGSTVPPRVNTSLPIEISMDGLTWAQIDDGEFIYVGLPFSERQDIHYTFTANGDQFRYLRVREPRSHTQGLAGYLDSTMMTLQVTPVGPAPTPTLTPQTGVVYSCETDILEDVFPDHPCTFGSPDRYDSASMFHTYPLGAARLDQIQVRVTILDFRIDDSVGDLGAPIWVQVSNNGVAFETVSSLNFANYGIEKTFTVTGLNDKEAKFIRLATGKHPAYNLQDARKHAEGYIHHSEIIVDGDLPS